MSSAARAIPARRYGSASELAAYSGVSLRTVRRRVADGTLRVIRLGHRVLIPLDAIDGPRTEESPAMATIHKPAGGPAGAEGPYVPLVSAEELAVSNRELSELLASWESEGDEQEQRATLAVRRESLGARRVASSRDLFP
jgi:excisionase family DNA binding protein